MRNFSLSLSLFLSTRDIISIKRYSFLHRARNDDNYLNNHLELLNLYGGEFSFQAYGIHRKTTPAEINVLV